MLAGWLACLLVGRRAAVGPLSEQGCGRRACGPAVHASIAGLVDLDSWTGERRACPAGLINRYGERASERYAYAYAYTGLVDISDQHLVEVDHAVERDAAAGVACGA